MGQCACHSRRGLHLSFALLVRRFSNAWFCARGNHDDVGAVESSLASLNTRTSWLGDLGPSLSSVCIGVDEIEPTCTHRP